jgi:hypothetical protein
LGIKEINEMIACKMEAENGPLQLLLLMRSDKWVFKDMYAMHVSGKRGKKDETG